ncbi:cell division ATP-binding protein FtsE [candidate division KSB1 bacterium]|nr:MAG: cell division ATP-binding protein FtsE [candidate division KSB1 bacterium]
MIQINNITVRFDRFVALKKVTFEIQKGEFIYIVGPSGAGKTTLFRLIYMDIFPEEGNIEIGNFNSLKITKKDIPFLRRKIGIVFQDFKLLEDRNVFDNVAFVLQVTGARKKEINKKVMRVLSEVGLHNKRFENPLNLSGGEQQRVVIARALVNEPFVLLADEPTGNLDRKTSLEILQLLVDINKKGTAVLVATHNMNLVKAFPAKIIRLENGEVVDTKY